MVLFSRTSLLLAIAAAVILKVRSCCAVALLSLRSKHVMPITGLGVIGMFDVYVRGKSQLMVVRRGAPLPADLVRGWRKKRAARNVSEEISRTVKREGF